MKRLFPFDIDSNAIVLFPVSADPGDSTTLLGRTSITFDIIAPPEGVVWSNFRPAVLNEQGTALDNGHFAAAQAGDKEATDLLSVQYIGTPTERGATVRASNIGNVPIVITRLRIPGRRYVAKTRTVTATPSISVEETSGNEVHKIESDLFENEALLEDRLQGLVDISQRKPKFLMLELTIGPHNDFGMRMYHRLDIGKKVRFKTEATDRVTRSDREYYVAHIDSYSAVGEPFIVVYTLTQTAEDAEKASAFFWILDRSKLDVDTILTGDTVLGRLRATFQSLFRL